MSAWQVRCAVWCETAFGGALYRAILWFERAVKGRLFGCSMCGQCALRYTGFVCPMQCPKGLRNGPCGGAQNGRCEVYPDRPCVWVVAYRRAGLLRRQDQLEKILPELDWSLVGTSAWLNHLAGRDGHLYQPQTTADIVPLVEAEPAEQDRRAA